MLSRGTEKKGSSRKGRIEHVHMVMEEIQKKETPVLKDIEGAITCLKGFFFFSMRRNRIDSISIRFGRKAERWYVGCWEEEQVSNCQF